MAHNIRYKPYSKILIKAESLCNILFSTAWIKLYDLHRTRTIGYATPTAYPRRPPVKHTSPSNRIPSFHEQQAWWLRSIHVNRSRYISFPRFHNVTPFDSYEKERVYHRIIRVNSPVLIRRRIAYELQIVAGENNKQRGQGRKYKFRLDAAEAQLVQTRMCINYYLPRWISAGLINSLSLFLFLYPSPPSIGYTEEETETDALHSSCVIWHCNRNPVMGYATRLSDRECGCIGYGYVCTRDER